jgi:GPH family glycoside/pentoside/hexuronide:cation symporter
MANLAKEFMFNVIVAALPFYAKYVIHLEDVPGGLDAVTQEALLLGAPFILSIPAMWVWTKITQRYGSRNAWIYASLAFIPGLVIVLLASSFTVAIIGTCTLVLGFPGLMMIYDLVVADVIDEDELVVGRRREGMFLGMNGAVIRLAFSVEAVLIATILPLTGYDASLAVQPEMAVLGFRFLMAGAPILALLVTVVALYFYPLHGERLHKVRARVDDLHRHKAARLAGELG